jgi:hypothetical protein
MFSHMVPPLKTNLLSSREQMLYVFGTFAVPIPSDAPTTMFISIPEWHDPCDPPFNGTDTVPFCSMQNYINQTDEARGIHRVCDGRQGGNYSGPDPGPAVLVSEDFLFWPLPEGVYLVKVDALMPNETDGRPGKRIFCIEAAVDLDY